MVEGMYKIKPLTVKAFQYDGSKEAADHLRNYFEQVKDISHGETGAIIFLNSGLGVRIYNNEWVVNHRTQKNDVRALIYSDEDFRNLYSRIEYSSDENIITIG